MECHINKFTTRKINQTKPNQVKYQVPNATQPISSIWLSHADIFISAMPPHTQCVVVVVFHHCYCFRPYERAVDKWYTVQIRDVLSNLL